MERCHSASEGMASDRVIDRRTFLKVAGLAGLGVVNANGAIGQSSPRPLTTPSPTTVADLALSLGYDVEQIQRFVSDQIRYEPYAGVLRGARGTLLARAGNSVDQAVLLAALLNASRVPYRFVSGRLDDESAERLLSTAVHDEARIQQEFVESLLGTAESAPTDSDQGSEFEELLAQGGVRPDDVGAWAEGRLEGAIDAITSALAGAGIEVPAAFSSMPELEREAHTWVQAAIGADWIDIDPTLPNDIGMAHPESEPTDVLPDDWFHTVQIDVTLEQVEAGGLTRHTILTHTGRATSLAGQPITFVNVLPEGLAALGYAITRLEGKKSYLPILNVGGVGHVGETPITFTVGGGVFDDDTGAAWADGDATGQWLEVTITSPGSDPTTVRRRIFDRIGEGRRYRGADLSHIQAVEWVTSSDGSESDYLPALTAHWLLVETGAPRLDGFQSSEADDDIGRLAIMAHARHVAQELLHAAVAVPRGVHPFRDRPNLVSFTVEQPAAAAAPAIAALDIWHRSFGALPVRDRPSTTAPMMVAGVLAHVAERMVFGGLPGLTPTPLQTGVGDLFEAADADGVAIRVVRDPSQVTGQGFAEDAAAHVAKSLADGWVVIAPERPIVLADRPQAGWWLLDPRDGRVADQMDSGRGAVKLEYADTLTPGQVAAQALRQRKLGCIYAGVFAVVTLILGVGSGALMALAAIHGVSGWKACALFALAFLVPLVTLEGLERIEQCLR
jgi:hypothetical protein